MKVTFGRHTCRCRIRVRWESGSLVSRVHTYALVETSNALGYLRVRGALSSHGFPWSNIFDVWGISILVFINNPYLRVGFEVCVLRIQYVCLNVNGPVVHSYILLSPGPQKLPEKLFTCQSYITPEPWTAAEPCVCVCVCAWMCI